MVLMEYLGEYCNQCNKARMLHPEAYIYTCPFCRFSFRMNPVVRGKGSVSILHKSEVKKYR